MASTPGYKTPPSLMHCRVCGRPGRDGERQGDTCGTPIDKAYKPLDDREYAEVFLSMRTGVPLPASHPGSIARERCMGTLLFPYLTD